MKRRHGIKGLITLLIVYCVSLAGFRLYLPSPSRREFKTNQSRYETIVRQAKSAGLQSNRAKVFIADALGNLEDARFASQNAPPDLNGKVEALCYENTFRILITTKDQGHFGSYGYLFSDAPLSITIQDQNKTTDVFGKTLALQEQLSPNWWIFHNHMD